MDPDQLRRRRRKSVHFRLAMDSIQRTPDAHSEIVPARRLGLVSRPAGVPAGMRFRNPTSASSGAELEHEGVRRLARSALANRCRAGSVLPVLSFAMGEPDMGYAGLLRLAGPARQPFLS